MAETVLGLAALYAIMSRTQEGWEDAWSADSWKLRSMAEYVYHRYFQHLGCFTALHCCERCRPQQIL